MNALIDQIYETDLVRDRLGNEYPLGGKVEKDQCRHLYKLIKADPSVVKTLEVGLAHGLSTMHICEALRGRKGAKHTVLDPNQRDQYHNIGLFNLEKLGVDYFEFIEKGSEYVLPKLAEEQPASFDFIFVDGRHTFDHALVDVFYSLRLLRIGGYLALDDCHWNSVAKVVEYIVNYPCLKIQSVWPFAGARIKIKKVLKNPVIRPFLPPSLKDRVKKRGRMVVFTKVAEDARSYLWYKPF